MTASKTGIKWVPILLVGLPLWLVASTALGLWLWLKGGEATEEPAKFSTSITTESIASSLNKFTDLVGPRHTASEAGRRGLTRAAAMIEGSLGPSNAGYQIETITAPPVGDESWPIIIARLPAGDKREPIWMLTGYDQNPKQTNPAGPVTNLTALIAVAQTLATETSSRPVYFVFLPHFFDDRAPVPDTLRALQRFIDRKESGGFLASVQAMSDGEHLTIHGTADLPLEALAANAKIQSSADETPGHPSLTALDALSLPVVHLRSTAPENTTSPNRPDPKQTAAASEQLAQWLRSQMRD